MAKMPAEINRKEMPLLLKVFLKKIILKTGKTRVENNRLVFDLNVKPIYMPFGRFIFVVMKKLSKFPLCLKLFKKMNGM